MADQLDELIKSNDGKSKLFGLVDKFIDKFGKSKIRGWILQRDDPELFKELEAEGLVKQFTSNHSDKLVVIADLAQIIKEGITRPKVREEMPKLYASLKNAGLLKFVPKYSYAAC